MITLIRWLLLPLSLLYQAIVWARNWLYDHQILKSTSFQTPTIVVGNLAVGGAGKSPMTELLIRFLIEKYKIATLSRGYGRKTKGFKIVETYSTAVEVGDEPLQFKNKYPEITVAVCEDRCKGIAKLEFEHDIILLDDAYQHRKLKGGFNILLFDFDSLFHPLLTLPTGNLRDNFSSTKRADLIVVTKSPDSISYKQKKHIHSLIKRHTRAPIYFSFIRYEVLKNLAGEDQNINLSGLKIILFCGIANPYPLKKHLSKLENQINLMRFPDHHNYSEADIKRICEKYDSTIGNNKIIITTEKDVQRIDRILFRDYPVYYLPISSRIESENSFKEHIMQYISQGLKRK